MRRFIAKLADMTSTFSYFLKKGEKFAWDAKCKKTLENIKRYLINAPILSPYKSKINLLLYIFATLSALGEMLAQKDNEGKERKIYYVNKKLIDYEIRYSNIEKIYFSIIFSIKKLRYYILETTMYVIA